LNHELVEKLKSIFALIPKKNIESMFVALSVSGISGKNRFGFLKRRGGKRETLAVPR
jgi:hypothetical protein